MHETRVRIINQLGLHARAAAQLVRLASKFKCKITIKRIDTSIIADAKSVLSVLNLGAAKGIELDLEFEGPDEREAMSAIERLFLDGFGEM
jgi:phosphocarrier protein HPr